MRFKVGVLGATGLVGQRLIQRLERHPWFDLVALGASERSAGRRYGDAVRWTLPGEPPAALSETPVSHCRIEAFAGCDLLFSALDSSVARDLEPALVEAGFAVVSNSSAHRESSDVPLVIPEVNAAHLGLLASGRDGGFLVTNPNCSVTGLAMAVAPLHRRFGIRRLVVATLQSISGAGVSGPRALDLVDNVVPFIDGEEPKLESELNKILGKLEGGQVSRADIGASAHCHRVPTLDGHLEAVSMELEGDPSPDEVRRTLEEFRGDVCDMALPSAPEPPIVVLDDPDRPQPRLDRDRGDGMAVVVGRIRRCPALGVKLELLSHNAVRGAAGGTLLNAELLAARGLLTEGAPA
jgi:aspartate-semialdehyde dehydrogenase